MVIFWNVFTAVHSAFMLSAFWGSTAMFFLVPFYALFFTIGFWLARAWYRARQAPRHFPEPSVSEGPVATAISGTASAGGQASPAQVATVVKVLGGITGGLLVFAVGLLVVNLLGSSFSFFQLMFPVGFGFAAYFTWNLRQEIRRRGVETGGFDLKEKSQVSPQWAEFLRRSRWLGNSFGVLLVLTFSLDFLLPDDVVPAMKAKLAQAVDLPEMASLYSGCDSTFAFLMSPRAAIHHHCHERLVSALEDPIWMLVGKLQALAGSEPLVMAAYRQRDAAAVQLLVRAGEPVDATDAEHQTALMRAVSRRDHDSVRALLAAGANPVFQARPQSHTALSSVLYDESVEMAAVLLQGRLELLNEQAKVFQYHPAHHAVNNGQLETLRLLLNLGLDVNATNDWDSARGETLLMAAARSHDNSLAMIDLLLARGARLDVLDRYGKNATDWAEFFGNRPASDALCHHGLEPTALDSRSPNNERKKRVSCREG